MPVNYWMNVCDRARTDVEMYSDNFLQTFGESAFFTICKQNVEGKLQWKDWSECSVTCGAGYQTRIASLCVPSYALCHEIPILERSCSNQICPIGQWTWNEWSKCSLSCGGGIRMKTADECIPKGAVCEETPIIQEACNEEACPTGQWSWNSWSDCSASCGGGIRIRTADSCFPENFICDGVPIQEESCNQSNCPDQSSM